jgi:O-antigen/teichoic acid export membrane protein
VLKRNLIANYLGQGWVALMNIAFIPWYIKYIGIEAYGMIGLFAVMQAWLTLLDMGMAPTLNREMGRFTGGAQTAASIRDLLRSVEAVVMVVGCLIVIGLWASAGWLASEWLQTEDLATTTVEQALTIMGAVIALQFLGSIYRSCLIGLQRQVLFNVINSAAATLRGLGAVAVLSFISPTLEAFFIWQIVVSVATLLILMASTYGYLPEIGRMGRFSMNALAGISSYAGGMMGITFLSLLLTQLDKVILSRLLTLSEYGYYMLAFVVAGGLSILLSPIVQAWYPRLSQLHAANETTELIEVYHEGAQLVSVIMGSAVLVLLMFSETILLLWTRDIELAQASSTLVKLLAVGNLLNGFMTMPYHAQLAYGWTGLAIRINVVAVILIIPAIFLVVPVYGAIGAATVWVCLNLGYSVIGIHFMYRKILTAEKWRWYREDILRPMFFAITMAFFLSLLLPDIQSSWHHILAICVSASLILVSAVCGAPLIYRRVCSNMLQWKAAR